MLTKEQETKLRNLIQKAAHQREIYVTALGVHQSNVAYKQLHADEEELDRFITSLTNAK